MMRKKLVKEIFTIFLLLSLLGSVFFIKKPAFEDRRENQALFNFLEKLPKDTLIVAHPYLADDISLLSKRKVFLNFELSHPIFLIYWGKIYQRTIDFFQAYYSDKIKTVNNFCQANKIDYFLVNKTDFEPQELEKEKLYFEPFNSMIKNELLTQKVFVLNNMPDEKKVFQWQNFYFN